MTSCSSLIGPVSPRRRHESAAGVRGRGRVRGARRRRQVSTYSYTYLHISTISTHIYNIYNYLPRCPHGRCVNTDPGYHCVCDPHYIPTQDRRGCMDGRQGTCYTKYLHCLHNIRSYLQGVPKTLQQQPLLRLSFEVQCSEKL